MLLCFYVKMKRGRKNSEVKQKRIKKGAEEKEEGEEGERASEEVGEKAAKKMKAGLDGEVVHVRSNGKAQMYVDYALKHLEESDEGAKVCIAGAGRAVSKTVAVVEMTKARFTELHPSHKLVQCSGTLQSVTIDGHEVPRIEIVLQTE